MDLNPKHRKSLRLKNYDYSTPTAYFITTCIGNNLYSFGKLNDQKIELNSFGEIVEDVWLNLPNHYSNCRLDFYCIMPDHFHGIVLLNDISKNNHSLTEIVRGFKTFSSRRINENSQIESKFIWQRSFYEKVLRSDNELFFVRKYILENPLRWNLKQGTEDVMNEKSY